jgi:hypothetical protein
MFDEASASYEDIDDTLFCFHLSEYFVEIIEVGDVALNERDIAAYRRFCLLELGKAAASDADIGSFIDETLSGREPDPAATTCDDCYFSIEF